MHELRELIQDAQIGDLEAFGTLVRKFQDMAVGYAFAVLGERTLAEDAAQEAFIEVHACLPALREPNAFASWLRKIVFKQCDRLTRGKRVTMLPLDMATEVPINANGPAEVMEQREIQHAVHSAIRALPEEQRMATTLFYISGYSQKEIAAFLDVSPKQVSNRLYSARKRLKERMLDMVQDTLQTERPSKDDTFAQQVMAIIEATQAGDVTKVGSMLDANPALVEATGSMKHGWGEALQPIHIAVAKGHSEIVEQLLDKGADVNALDDRGRTPLQIAVGQQQSTLVDLLIKREAKLDIFSAARLCDTKQVATLLNEDANLANAKGPDGAVPLHYASDVGITRLLIEHGADVNVRDDHGLPPIVWQGANPEIARFLIVQGAEVEDIFFAASIGADDLVQKFLADDPALVHSVKTVRGNALTPLMAAIFGQHPNVVRLLLGHGADANARLFGGEVPILHEAIKIGNVETVRLLLEHGADVDATQQAAVEQLLATAE